MDRAAVALTARGAHAVGVQPLGRGLMSAVLARLVLRDARRAGAFDQGGERVQQLRFREPPPLDDADAPRTRGERVRRLPHPGELRDDDARIGEEGDDFRRLAARERQRPVTRLPLVDRRGQVRAEKSDQLFESFLDVHDTHYVSAPAPHAPGFEKSTFTACGRVGTVIDTWRSVPVELRTTTSCVPRSTGNENSGVAPTRAPSTKTSAVSLAVTVSADFGGVTDTVVTWPGRMSTFRTSSNASDLFSTRSSCAPGPSMI